MRQLLLLDCDGTIREPIQGKWIDTPRNQRAIPGTAEAITKASSAGWTIIGITNQGGVAAGHKSLNDAIKEQLYTLELFPQMEKIYFCPDFEGEICWCIHEEQVQIWRSLLPRPSRETYKKFRKPEPGMIELALDWLGEIPEKFGMWAIAMKMPWQQLPLE